MVLKWETFRLRRFEIAATVACSGGKKSVFLFCYSFSFVLQKVQLFLYILFVHKHGKKWANNSRFAQVSGERFGLYIAGMIRVKSLSELTYPKPSLRVAASIPRVDRDERPVQVAIEYVDCEQTENGGERGLSWFGGRRTADCGGEERPKNSVSRRLEELVKNVIWTEDRWPEDGPLGWRRKCDAIALLEEFIAKLVSETYLGVKPGQKKRKIVLGLDELIKRLTAEPEVANLKKTNNPFRGDYKEKLSPEARELVSNVSAACLHEYRKRNRPHQLEATQQPFTCEIGQLATPFSPKSPQKPKFCIPAETLLPYRRDKKSGYRIVKNATEIEIPVPKKSNKRRSKRKVIPEIQTPPRERDAEKKLRDYRASRRSARRNKLQEIQLDETSTNSEVKAREETITVSSDEESLEKRLQQFQPNKKIKINNNSKQQPIETIPLKAEETNRLKIDQPISPPKVIDNHWFDCPRPWNHSYARYSASLSSCYGRDWIWKPRLPASQRFHAISSPHRSFDPNFWLNLAFFASKEARIRSLTLGGRKYHGNMYWVEKDNKFSCFVLYLYVSCCKIL